MSHNPSSVVPFQTAIKVLLDMERPFPPKYLSRFSDLEEENLSKVRQVWNQVDIQRRISLLEDLEDMYDSDTLVCFDELAHFTLTDPDPRVRILSIRLLWEADDTHTADELLKMMTTDPVVEVRAQAASGLGNFVLYGELEEIPEHLYERILNNLLKVYRANDDSLVRRRCLESLGYHSSDEVDALVLQAYGSGKSEWLVSSLVSMGRSADPRWERQVLEMFVHPDADVRSEAVHAAGELELDSAREPLLILLEEADELDEELLYHTLWALSKIGGEGVRAALEAFAEKTEDDDTDDILEEVLENLESTEMNQFGMLEFDMENATDEEVDEEGHDEDKKGNRSK